MSIIDTIAKAKAWDEAQAQQQNNAVKSAFALGERIGAEKLAQWLGSQQPVESSYRPYDEINSTQQTVVAEQNYNHPELSRFGRGMQV